jgi:pimeloyl-ACP methyl ester carboxylesterase
MEELMLSTRFGQVFAMGTGDVSAPLVLAIHGWSQRNGWHSWEPLMVPLAAADFRVVSVDMPGWGQSRAVVPVPLSPEDAKGTVLNLLESLGAESAVLMGKSWGGGVAISLALTQPDRVEKMILTAPAFREPQRLPELTKPVLLTWAEDDPVIPFAYARVIAEAIPSCRLVTYSHGGHNAAAYNAVDFAIQAAEFLKA